MTIIVNGETKTIQQTVSIATLLEQLKIEAQAVVIEYNGAVLDKENWAATTCQDQDQIEVVRFLGGG